MQGHDSILRRPRLDRDFGEKQADIVSAGRPYVTYGRVARRPWSSQMRVIVLVIACAAASPHDHHEHHHHHHRTSSSAAPPSFCDLSYSPPSDALADALLARVSANSAQQPAPSQPVEALRLLCSRLADAWASTGRLAHYAIQSVPLELPPADEAYPLKHLALTGNAGDAVLPLAARWAISFFLSGSSSTRAPPFGPFNASAEGVRWSLFQLRRARLQPKQVEFMNEPRNRVLGVIVGGGGLFYPRSAFSRQAISGWQWQAPTPLLRRLAPRLFLFGVGFNEFDGSVQSSSEASTDPSVNRSHLEAFRRSWAALADGSSAIGLRESHSLRHMRARFPLPTAEGQARVRYQPCATTLVGHVHPSLASTTLLGRAKVLSINLAADQPNLRLGEGGEPIVLEALLLWAEGAARRGWHVHVVDTMMGDSARFLAYAGGRLRSGGIEHVPWRHCCSSYSRIYRYYRGVTVAASMRGHGVMVPFGIHCATISLLSHDKVRAFIDDIGRPEWGVELSSRRRAAKGSAAIAAELTALLERIHTNRTAIYEQIVAAQRALVAVTARNMVPLAEDVLRRARAVA